MPRKGRKLDEVADEVIASALRDSAGALSFAARTLGVSPATLSDRIARSSSLEGLVRRKGMYAAVPPPPPPPVREKPFRERTPYQKRLSRMPLKWKYRTHTPRNKPAATDAEIAQALSDQYGLLRYAAIQVGMSTAGLKARITASEDLQLVLEEAIDARLDISEYKLFHAIESGQAWAITLHLKTQGKKRGYVERTELTGKDGEDLSMPQLQVVLTHDGGDAVREDSSAPKTVPGL